MSGDDLLRPRAGIAWARDAGRIVVAGAETATVLEGFDAVVWSCLSLSPSWRRVTQIVAALLRIKVEDADERIRVLVSAWRRAGLLEPADAAEAALGG